MDFYSLGYGFTISVSITYMLCLFMTAMQSEIKEAVFFPNRESFTEWRGYIKLSLPVMALITIFYLA